MINNYTYNAKLLKVIDGDTIDAMIDLGFDIWTKKRIRLYGLNAPETRTTDTEEKDRGLHSKERLNALMDEYGGLFTIKSHGVEKYGRCLGELWVGEEKINVNELLLREGLAVPYMV